MAEQENRNEAAYTAVLTHLQQWGLSQADAAEAMQFALVGQEAYWREAIDGAVGGVDINLFVKRYHYLGVQKIEAQLFVPSPKRPEDWENLDNWLPVLTGLEAQRDAFADATRTGARRDAPDAGDASDSPRDPVVTFEIGTVIAEALRPLLA